MLSKSPVDERACLLYFYLSEIHESMDINECIKFMSIYVISFMFFHTWYFSILTLFTKPSARAGYDTRSIFKRSLTGLNSEFSFS